ncbi:MAG: hypothetical protein U0325_14130 [Polyangiales bacterium]
MVNREEFERIVRAMRAEGVALTMPNLMLRTELPRATIERWLEEVESQRRRDDGAWKKSEEGERPLDALRGKVDALRREAVKAVATAAVKESLGLEETPRVHGAMQRKGKDLRWGAGLGLLAGPLGLFYAAPLPVAAASSAGYVAAILLLRLIPVFGSVAVAYLVPLVHLGCAAAGAAYAWRHNRTGRRAALFPNGIDLKARK